MDYSEIEESSPDRYQMKYLYMQNSKKQNRAHTNLGAQYGFTLLELMIAISVLAIGLTLAVPSIRTIAANNQISVANNSIITGFNLARSEAVTRGNNVAICPSSDGDTCDDDNWDKGWIVFDDADGSGSMAETEVIRRVFRKSDVTRAGLSGNVVFKPDGTQTTAGDTITICHDPDVTDKCRLITITRFGLVTSQETTS